MQQNIKIGTMNLPKEFKKYCALRKLKTLEVLLLHPRIAQDYEKKKTLCRIFERSGTDFRFIKYYRSQRATF